MQYAVAFVDETESFIVDFVEIGSKVPVMGMQKLVIDLDDRSG